MISFEWLNDKCQKCDGDFIETVCPMLKNNCCTIYETRPSCCRNHPQNNGYCVSGDCLLIGKEKNTKESSVICIECGAKCCKRILIPKNQIITKKFMLRWMDIDCQTCRNLFGKISKLNKE